MATTQPTIDRDFKASGLSCKIQPFKAKFDDKDDVTHLRVTVTNNNMKDNASLYWEVLTEKGEKMHSGVVVLGNADYTSFESDKMFAWSYVATKLNISFI